VAAVELGRDHTGVAVMDAIKHASREFMAAAEKSTTLYALSDTYTALLMQLDDPETDQELILEELGRISGEIRVKAENIAGLVARCEGWATIRKAEAQRLRQLAEQDEKKADWLRAYVLREMQDLGIVRIDTDRYIFSVRQNPPRVEVLEAMAVPHEFQREKVIIETDKKAILEHYKQTGEIPAGVEIVRHERLDIR
jgi:Siphovirus Gp157